jgi:hypothetical protein
LDGAFCDTILMMGANVRERLGLIGTQEGVGPEFGRKNMDFESAFGFERLGGSQGRLGVYQHKAGVVIIEDCTTAMFGGLTFSPTS